MILIHGGRKCFCEVGVALASQKRGLEWLMGKGKGSLF